MKLTDLLTPTYIQMLNALSAWLDKAAGQVGADEGEKLLAARLAPDMFPLSTQVRFACVQALEGMYRLRGEAFPPEMGDLLKEGQNGGEHPGSLAQAKARIAETVSSVQSLATDMTEPDAGAPMAHELPNGMVFDLGTEQYARDWALGQFYFHIMTAYAILRQQGVALGKADYVAHMMGHLRPETIPGAQKEE
ncbi:DUF1993 domain-containing protein [Novosphingopyxis iocasae]|uniref:DUF1993 domain-containing protein n=1 Tax=Novosphingopyxis iocasae TaxID=2762729 RepID=UPI000C412BE5|nr:DUF1993 domain-containing protein [Novosphingopyxis iocasae]MAC12352.1 hypothetical protein [Sphingorhabdus sp.]